MTIRQAMPKDASALAALSIEVWLHTYCRPGIPPMFADYALEAFKPDLMDKLINDPAEHVLLDCVNYEGQDGIRGYLVWNESEAPPLPQCPLVEIETLYIRERHKREGIGSNLLEACYEAARSAGHHSAFLKLNAENTPARDFYFRKGFRQIGETHFEIDGNRYLNLVLQIEF